MKRARVGCEELESKKRRVEIKSFKKWKTELDRDHQTLIWLECVPTSCKKLVDKLKCKVCARFVDKLVGMRNFNDKWINGATSLRISNIFKLLASYITKGGIVCPAALTHPMTVT